MKIGLACGGTGGHIFPGLATAELLKQRGHEVVLWLAGKDVETPALKSWAGPVVTVYAEGFPSGISLRAIQTAYRLLRASASCTRIMSHDRPQVILAMGSYASVGPLVAASLLHVPAVLHEANVLPGRAISLFSRRATVAASFEETRYYLPNQDLVVTGMPIRQDLEAAARKQPQKFFGKDALTFLAMGGSRGAHRLNNVVSEAVCKVHARGGKIRIIHLSGVADETAMKDLYAKSGVDHVVQAFAQDMPSIYPQIDVAICRSGAATCAELSVFGIPSLLVPYPFAARDHQMANARALEKSGAADVVPESDMSADWLAEYMQGCLQNRARLARMSAAGRARTVKSGTEALANLVEETAMRHPQKK